MCKSLAEGGQRCAAHTRPAYRRALDTATTTAAATGGPLALATTDALTDAAAAYAATPTGQTQVLADADTHSAAGRTALADVLRRAAVDGARHYAAAKEATARIETEKLREESGRWARRAPEHPAALQEYLTLVSRETGQSVEDLQLRFASYQAAGEAIPDPVPDLDQARFLTVVDGETVGTPADPAGLRALAEIEALAADTRRKRRARIETVDDDGRRWVKYENEQLSEVLRSVSYDEADRTARIILVGRGADATSTEYLYRDVHPSLIRTMVSARSMGRFYAYVFANHPDGASLGSAPVTRYSYAAHAANGLLPVGTSTGPVPRKMLRELAFRPAPAVAAR